MAKNYPDPNSNKHHKLNKQVETRLPYQDNFETREYLMSLIDNSPYGVIAINLEGSITIMNLLAAEYLALDKDLNKNIKHAVLPLINDITELHDVIKSCLTEGLKPFDLTCVSYRQRFLSLKGRIIVNGLLITIEDITEQKEARERLLQNQFLLKEFQKIARVGGWELDLRSGTDVGYMTEEVYRIYDLPLNEQMHISKGLSFFPPESKPIIEKALKELIEKGKEYDLELPFVTAKGDRRWTRAIGKAVYEGNKVVKIRGIFSDITSLNGHEKTCK